MFIEGNFKIKLYCHSCLLKKNFGGIILDSEQVANIVYACSVMSDSLQPYAP